MVRMALATVALGLLGLFGYFYATGSGEHGNERAREAAWQVGGTVKDQGVQQMVWARLAAKYGLDGARFLHVHYHEGKVLIYGLLPAGAAPQQLAGEVDELPGVREVEVQTLPRPAYLEPPASQPAVAPPAAPRRP